MAILEGRDPDAEEYYGVAAPGRDQTIEAPARRIHMVSEPVALPETLVEPENGGEAQGEAEKAETVQDAQWRSAGEVRQTDEESAEQ